VWHCGNYVCVALLSLRVALSHWNYCLCMFIGCQIFWSLLQPHWKYWTSPRSHIFEESLPHSEQNLLHREHEVTC